MLHPIVPRRILSATASTSRGLRTSSSAQSCPCRRLFSSPDGLSESSLSSGSLAIQTRAQRSRFTTSASTPTHSQPQSSPFRLSSRSTPNKAKSSLPPSDHEHPERGQEKHIYRNPNETPDDLEEAEGSYSPYQPKRQWPPDMSKLSPKHQFRLERKYRRRAALKYARPRWVKWTKMAQMGIIAFVLVYSVLFMDFGNEKHPFEEFRKEFFGTLNSIFFPKRPEPVLPSPRREGSDGE